MWLDSCQNPLMKWPRVLGWVSGARPGNGDPEEATEGSLSACGGHRRFCPQEGRGGEEQAASAFLAGLSFKGAVDVADFISPMSVAVPCSLDLFPISSPAPSLSAFSAEGALCESAFLPQMALGAHCVPGLHVEPDCSCAQGGKQFY